MKQPKTLIHLLKINKGFNKTGNSSNNAQDSKSNQITPDEPHDNFPSQKSPLWINNDEKNVNRLEELFDDNKIIDTRRAELISNIRAQGIEKGKMAQAHSSKMRNKYGNILNKNGFDNLVEDYAEGEVNKQIGNMKAIGDRKNKIGKTTYGSTIANIDRTNSAIDEVGGVDNYAKLMSAFSAADIHKQENLLKVAENIAKAMFEKGNNSWGMNGKPLTGKDALKRFYEAQSNKVRGIVSDDGKEAYDFRVGKDGQVELAAIEQGIKYDPTASIFKGLNDIFGKDKTEFFMDALKAGALGGLTLGALNKLIKVGNKIDPKMAEKMGLTFEKGRGWINAKGELIADTEGYILDKHGKRLKEGIVSKVWDGLWDKGRELVGDKFVSQPTNNTPYKSHNATNQENSHSADNGKNESFHNNPPSQKSPSSINNDEKNVNRLEELFDDNKIIDTRREELINKIESKRPRKPERIETKEKLLEALRNKEPINKDWLKELGISDKEIQSDFKDLVDNGDILSPEKFEEYQGAVQELEKKGLKKTALKIGKRFLKYAGIAGVGYSLYDLADKYNENIKAGMSPLQAAGETAYDFADETTFGAVDGMTKQYKKAVADFQRGDYIKGIKDSLNIPVKGIESAYNNMVNLSQQAIDWVQSWWSGDQNQKVSPTTANAINTSLTPHDVHQSVTSQVQSIQFQQRMAENQEYMRQFVNLGAFGTTVQTAAGELSLSTSRQGTLMIGDYQTNVPVNDFRNYMNTNPDAYQSFVSMLSNSKYIKTFDKIF